MNQNFIPAIIFFLIGMMITIIGALFKLMHWTGANALLTIGLLSEALSILILIIAIIKTKKK